MNRLGTWLSRFCTFQNVLITLLVVLEIVSASVLFFDCVENWVSVLVGVTTKNKILKFLGIGMGGILIVLLHYLFWKSAMNLVSKIKENSLLIFQVVLVVLLIVLAIVFVVVMCSKNPEWIFNLLGINENGKPNSLLGINESGERNKYEVLKFLGISMGGILVALQALASHRRARAMEDTAKHTEQGQRQERLKNAIEHLGNEKDSVRLGGIYELFHLAEDNEDLRRTALDILCAHIRRTTSETIYRAVHRSKPSEEVQSLLTLLFVKEYEVFKSCDINLWGCWLNGAESQKSAFTESHSEWGVPTRGYPYRSALARS